MVVTRSGIVGVGVARHADRELGVALVYAPVPHQQTVEMTAVDWDNLQNCRDVPCPGVQVFLFMEVTRSGVVGVGVTRRADWELEDALVTCTNPPPENGGNCCCELGRATEVQLMVITSQWSNWSQCSSHAQEELSVALVHVPVLRLQTKEENAGDWDELQNFENVNTHNCPVDGGYTDWSSLVRIVVSRVVMELNSVIDHAPTPPPANNGTSCRGPANETRICTPKVCTKPSVTYAESCRDFSRRCTDWDKFCKAANTFKEIVQRHVEGVYKVHYVHVRFVLVLAEI
ncbi:hypothetical protein OS493_039138 [Desmophyllum pertusum]|uniref:Uncharacterized protein n=1 Tax=Desmophyllum pertusum TaxID=174260 RepID=A0A9W9ZHC9_9CNID|nr:hypothetical protein OS493_039138 [Desmophyllum pertusum]